MPSSIEEVERCVLAGLTDKLIAADTVRALVQHRSKGRISNGVLKPSESKKRYPHTAEIDKANMVRLIGALADPELR